MGNKLSRQALTDVSTKIDALSLALDPRNAIDLLAALADSASGQGDSLGQQKEHQALVSRLVGLMTDWLWSLRDATARRQAYGPLLALLRRAHALSGTVTPLFEMRLLQWISRLDHAERIQRLLAIDVLVRIGSHASINALLAALERSDYEIRDEIARAFRTLPDAYPDAYYHFYGGGVCNLFEEWLQRLNADDAELSELASRELTWLANHAWFSRSRPDFWARVWAKSEADDEPLRIAVACRLVGAQADAEPAAWLIERLDRFGRADARRAAARLSLYPDPRQAPQWLALLTHSDVQLRGFAATALGLALDKPEVRQALLDALADQEPEVALAAALNLCDLPAAREDIDAWTELMLQSSSARHQAQALILIGKVRMSHFREAVMELARYAPPRLRLKAVYVLGRLGDEASRSLLWELLEHGKPSPALKAQLVQALRHQLSSDDVKRLAHLGLH